MTSTNKTKKRGPYPDKYRAERARLIRKTRPWDKTTGPKTRAGKATASRNSLKHGLRSAHILTLRALLRAQAAQLKTFTHGKNLPLVTDFLRQGGKI